MDLGLKGKRAVVMGASRGLGLGIARALAAEGCHLVLAARSADKLVLEAERLTAQWRVEVDPTALDLGDDASVRAACGRIAAKGGADILVTNCGGPPPSGALGVAAETWRRQFQAMVLGVITVVDALVPGMRARKWGRVLVIGSSGVVQPIPTLAMSNSLRAGLVAFAKTLAGEVAADGVTVNSLLPGRIATDRVAELDEVAARRRGVDVDAVRSEAAATIPVGRYGQIEEFAAVAAFLVSERASYVTGHAMRVDGGLIRAI